MNRFKELFRFFTNPVFYIPLFLIIGIEILLRTGIYENILKPQSYLANVLRIKKIIKESRITPQILIMGTSIPYQGLLLNKLNQYSNYYRFQSVATQAAFLETQYALLKYALENQKGIQYIIHFVDVDFPWQQKKTLEVANRSMLSQFNISFVLELLKNHHYELSFEDYAFFYIKMIQYKADLRDFLLNPFSRLKSIKKNRIKFNEYNDYAFINDSRYAISVYGKTVEECIENSKKGIPFYKEGHQITDEPHRRAVLDTCRMAMYDPFYSPNKFFSEKLYELRLTALYKFIIERNLYLIAVIPPYSDLAPLLKKEDKFNYLKDLIHSIDRKIIILDLRNSLNAEKNLEYFYDTIHLNQMGAEIFTKIFYSEVDRILRMSLKIN